MLLIALAVATSCGGESAPRAELPPCDQHTPSKKSPPIPAEMALDRHATIISVKERGSAIGITAVSELSVVELYPPLARGVLDAGFRIVSSDNEGFEAEIFFGGRDVTGAYRLREAPCKKQVFVRLLYEESGR